MLINLSGNTTGSKNSAEKQLGLLKSQLVYVDINDIIARGMHEYLDDFQKKLNKISSAIHDVFCSRENHIID